MSSSPAQLTYFPPVSCLWGQINWGRRVRKHLLAMLLSLKLHLARTLFTLFCQPYLLRSELPHPHSQNCESLPWLFTKHMRLQSQLLKGDIFGHIRYGILLQIMFSLTCSDLSDIQFEVKSTVSNVFTLSLRLPPGHLLRISPVAPVTPSKANEGRALGRYWHCSPACPIYRAWLLIESFGILSYNPFQTLTRENEQNGQNCSCVENPCWKYFPSKKACLSHHLCLFCGKSKAEDLCSIL